MSVHKDTNGTYLFVAKFKDGDGYKQIKRRGFKSKKEAKMAEAQFLLDMESEKEKQEETMTFGTLAEEYLEWYGRRRKLSSFNKIKGIIKTNILPTFKNKRIDQIRNRDIIKFQDKLIDNYSANHAKKIHTTLSAVFNFGIKNELITHNPAAAVGNIEKQDERKINYWTLDQFKQFISTVDDLMYRTFFMTLYYSGVRKGEALALTWADVDFESSTIRINKTAYNRQVTATKTASSNRTLIMPSHTMDLLQLLKSETVYYKDEYVVFGEFNDHLPTTSIDREYAKYVKRAGIKKIRIHDFRHSHASYLINQGAMASIVAQRLGHSDVGTTLNIYSHLYPSTEKEAILKMEDDFKTAKLYQIK